jgi:predicted glycoside hydrolase/deacetylase ChbG (UPF0249 family)
VAGKRFLIVNADDFGQSAGINRGVLLAHVHGIVMSTSLMVRWPASAAACAAARGHPALSLGLHVDLGEWAYRGDTWVPVYEVVPTTDRQAVADEVARQLEQFERLAGRRPTHLDSHQHVHREEPVRSVLLECARRLGVPLRGCDAAVQYCGDFYGQSAKGWPCPESVTVDALVTTLERLPAGITELGCHPAANADVESTYRAERIEETKTLCDERVRAALARCGIALCSYHDLPRLDRA